ncbi:MAG: AAA family ATPase [Oscillospiraceae bacterium]|nr:AAA family ATPase [Oscillospiraceae bacterium]
MGYISTEEAASLLGISPRRIQQMCNKGQIKGAERNGRKWMIPDTIVRNDDKAHFSRRSLPIGISDFRNAVTNYYYVDKTLFVKDFLDRRVQVSLFTRPRRFGKTLNMDMLRVFFELSDEDTSVYFQDKAVWACGDQYRQHQGKYPVIYLSFKDVKYSTWENALANISALISMEFDRHRYLMDSDLCSSAEKRFFQKVVDREASAVDLADSLKMLSKMLASHHKTPVIIMIDEYDTPIQEGYLDGYYDEVIEFVRNLFSGGFKDNPNLVFGFLTGILRVAKESIFSGMNNLKVYSITDNLYSEYFGFTKKEVKDLLGYYGAEDKFDEICSWYDGYLFGDQEILNPWSVINYISEECVAKPFWQSTGSNDIIGEILSDASTEINDNLVKLMKGESITTYVDTSVIYPEIKSKPSSVYSFLLTTGYLRISHIYPQTDGEIMCDVSIPNREISRVFVSEVINRFPKGSIEPTAIGIQQAIFKKDFQKLQQLLEDYVIQTISSFDLGSEGFYQGFMLGICAIFNNRYYVRSNRESGFGRFDIQLEPMEKVLPGFIFELKFDRDKDADLDSMLQEAAKQIEEKRYDVEMRAKGVEEVIKIGIAFAGKNVKLYRL